MSSRWRRLWAIAVAAAVAAALCGGFVFAETPGDVVGWDLQYHGGLLPNGHQVPPPTVMLTRSPLRRGAADYYAPIKRADFELSTSEAVVHRGADLAALGEAVYAARAGTVVEVLPPGDVVPGRVVVGHGPGSSTNFDYYSFYVNIDPVSLWPGQPVTTDTLLGRVSPDKTVLEFGFSTTMTGGWSAENRIVLPLEYFYSAVNGWTNGKDLDFINVPRAYQGLVGTVVEARVHALDGVGGDPSAWIWVRLENGAQWQRYEMYESPIDPGLFSRCLAHLGYDFRYVQYWVEVRRTNSTLGYVSRPLHYYTKEPGEYYKTYVQP